MTSSDNSELEISEMKKKLIFLTFKFRMTVKKVSRPPQKSLFLFVNVGQVIFRSFKSKNFLRKK